MAAKWQDKPRTVRISSLKLSGGWKARLTKPHVLALAQSIVQTGPINLPAVCWTLDGEKRRELAAGEDRAAAQVLVACWRKARVLGAPLTADTEDPTSMLGEARWQVAQNNASAGQGMDVNVLVRAFDADTEHDIKVVRAHENAHRRHDDRDKWLADLARAAREEIPTTERGADAGDDHASGDDPCKGMGGDASPGDTEAGAAATPAGGSASPGPVALEPPDNIAQGFVDDQLPPCISCDSNAVGRVLGVFKCFDCKAEWDVPVKQQAGAPSVPSQPVTVETNRQKGERRKKAAALASEVEGKPTSPAAVKQAEYRERKREGKVNPRQKHDDGGPALPESAQPVLRALIDCDANLQALVTRLGNALREHPELSDRFPLLQHLQAAKDLRRALKGCQPHAPCVFCFGAGEKAACHACRGQRWITRDELEGAPAETRKAAGL